jgi:hypothetical protein
VCVFGFLSTFFVFNVMDEREVCQNNKTKKVEIREKKNVFAFWDNSFKIGHLLSDRNFLQIGL